MRAAALVLLTLVAATPAGAPSVRRPLGIRDVRGWHGELREAFERGTLGPGQPIELELEGPFDGGAVIPRLVAAIDGVPVALRLPTAADLAPFGPPPRPPSPLENGRLVVVPARPVPAGSTLQLCEAPPVRRCVALQGAPPLHVRQYDQQALPGEPWNIWLSAALDTEAFRPEWITVEPPLEALEVRVRKGIAGHIHVAGRTEGGRRYRVTLSGELRDHAGRTLGAPVTLEIPILAPRGPPAVGAPDDNGVAVVRPGGAPRYVAWATAGQIVQARLRPVRPEDFPAFAAAVRRVPGRKPSDAPPLHGRPLRARPIAVPPSADGMGAVEVDLSPALRRRTGHAIVELESEGTAPKRVLTWVQVTDLAIDAAEVGDQLHVWVTSLSRQAPVAGATVELFPSKRKAITGADGVARLPLAGLATGGRVLVARLGSDAALLPERSGGRDDPPSTTTADAGAALRWSLLVAEPDAERRIEVAGWVVAPPGRPGVAPRTVELELRERDGAVVARGVAETSAGGTFRALLDGSKLSKEPVGIRRTTPPGGRTRYDREGPKVVLRARDLPAGVTASEVLADVHPVLRRDTERLRVEPLAGPAGAAGGLAFRLYASDVAGRPAAGARLAWEARSDPAHLEVLPGAPAFGTGSRLSRMGGAVAGLGEKTDLLARDAAGRLERGEVTTDANGTARLELSTGVLGDDGPRTVSVVARLVAEPRVMSGTWMGPYTPGDVVVGLRLGSRTVGIGEPIVGEARLAAPSGGPAPDLPVRLEAAPAVWEPDRDRWVPAGSASECEGRAALDPLRCELAAPTPGPWIVSATATSPGETSVAADLAFVTGGAPLAVLDRPLVEAEGPYAVSGTTARVLVLAPSPSPYALWLSRAGRGTSGSARLEGGKAELEVTLPDGIDRYAPLEVVALGDVRCEAEGLLRLPALAPGRALQPVDRSLVVSLRAPAVAAPGALLELDVGVGVADGAPGDVLAWLEPAPAGTRPDGTPVLSALRRTPSHPPAWSSTRTFEPCPGLPKPRRWGFDTRGVGAISGTAWGTHAADALAPRVARTRPASGIVSAPLAAGGRARLSVRAPPVPGTYLVHVVAHQGERAGEMRVPLEVRAAR